MDQLEKLLEKQNTLLQSLVEKSNSNGLYTKAPASFSTYTPLHGPGGIWNEQGIERDVISAYMRPMGLALSLIHI